MEENKKPTESEQPKKPVAPQLLVDIITARRDVDGLYIIPIEDGSDVAIPLNWYLGAVTNCKGTWQSLGMAHNPAPGVNSIEIAVYYAVPENSGFMNMVADLINKLREMKDDKKTDTTKNN